VYDRGAARDPMAPSGPIVIELGVLGHDDDDDGFAFHGSGRHPRPSPWLVVLLILACCGAGVTAAGEPALPPRLVFTASDVSDSPLVNGDSLLATVDGSEGNRITSYDLASGAVRWQFRPVRRNVVLPAGDVVLVAPVSCSARSAFQTVALDAVTGERRWELRGAPIWLVDGAPIVVVKSPERGCTEATLGFDPLPSATFWWMGIDLATGDMRWRIKVPGAVNMTAGTDGSGKARWMAVADEGVITTYDLRTGAVAGQYDPPGTGTFNPLSRILGAGDRLLIVTRMRGTLEVAAFDAPGLLPTWRIVTTPPWNGVRLDLDGFAASWCGRTICLGPGGETIGLDPDNGQERWRLPGRPTRVGPGFGLFVRPPPVVAEPTFAVHDLLSGAERATLPEIDLMSRTWGDPLLNQPGAHGRLWRLDLADGVMHAVTVLPGLFADCDFGGRYLACRNSDGEMRVWRLPADCPPSCGGRPVASGGASRDLVAADRRLPWPTS
jgi:hypothetical protein